MVMMGWKMIGNFLSLYYHTRWWRKLCAETLKKVFSKLMRKMVLRKIFWHFLHMTIFMFILLISNHTVFLAQFGIFFFYNSTLLTKQHLQYLLTIWHTYATNNTLLYSVYTYTPTFTYLYNIKRGGGDVEQTYF